MRLISDSYHIIGRPYLARAYSLAILGARTTAPNPMVGCVIVRDGMIVGEGYHAKAGGPHAEIVALGHAGDKAKGATAYVTLEPCNHTGKTPPCTEALITAGVTRVVIGMPDPNTQAAGGAARLAEAGIKVEFAEDPRPFEELNRGWITRIRTGMPHIRVKLAMSLDAAISLNRNEPTVISGPSGAEVTRLLREYTDAILVSSSTAHADNPALTLRGVNGELAPEQPKRIVLVRTHAPEPALNLFTDKKAPTYVLHPDDFDCTTCTGVDAEFIEYPVSGGLRGALTALGTLGVNDLLVESGQRLFTELYNSRLIDELVTVSAGGMLGVDALRCYRGIANLEPSHGGATVMEHKFAPFDTKIYGDVVATMWRPRARRER